MKKVVSLILIAILTVSMFVMDVSAAKVYTVKLDTVDSYTDAFTVLNRVNTARQQQNLGKLTMDKELMENAMARAHEIALKYSHTRPNGKGFVDMNNRIYGENIAVGSFDADYIVNNWLGSKLQRKIIMTDYYVSTGVGAAQVNGTFYWVQLFGVDLSETASQSDYEDTYTGTTDISFIKSAVDADVKFGDPNIGMGSTTRATLSFNNGFTYVNVDSAELTYKSSNTNVCTISELGKIRGLNRGESLIEIFLPGDDYAFVSKVIHINGEVDGITLNYNSYTYYRYNKSKTIYLKTTIWPATALDKRVTWKSDNPSVATVSSSGKVTMKKKGTARITATSVDSPGIKKVCKIKVFQNITKVGLTKNKIKIKKGKKATIKAKITPTNANIRQVYWSTNKNIVKVKSTGRTPNTCQIIAKKKGKAVVTATARDGSKRKAKCVVVVN